MLRPDRVFVIAEVGSNHMGDLDMALRHIRMAKECGADAAKFQLFRPEDILVDPSACDPRTVLPPEWIPALHAECESVGLVFMCTPFSEWAVQLLTPYTTIWKVGSFEHKRRDVLDAIGETGIPVIASCGRGKPDIRNRHYLLYCVSKYPAYPQDIDMPVFGDGYDGFSDHTLSTVLPAIAVSRGAIIIEKHFRLFDHVEESPDYPHSLDPHQFKEMVANIRLAESTCLCPQPTSQVPSQYPNRRE